MAKFCKDCGTQVEEGSICSCKGTEAGVQQEAVQQQEVQQQPVQQQPVQQQPVQQQPVQQQPVQQQAQQNSEFVDQAKAVAGSSWKMAKDMIMAPEVGIASCMKDSNRQLALSLIGAQAILSAIFAVLVTKQYEKMMNNLFGNWGSAIEIFSNGRTLMVTIVCSLIISCILFGLLYAVNSIFKLELSTDNLLAAVSARSVGVSLLIAVAMIVALVDLGKGIMLFYAAGILGMFFLESAIKPYLKVKQVMAPYIMFGILVIFAGLGYFVMIKGVPYYLPEEMRGIFEGMKEMLNDPVGFMMNEMF